jgi:hypothetical protein
MGLAFKRSCWLWDMVSVAWSMAPSGMRFRPWRDAMSETATAPTTGTLPKHAGFPDGTAAVFKKTKVFSRFRQAHGA